MIDPGYAAFLASKAPSPHWSGIEPGPMPDCLFPFQAACVEFLLKAGRGGLFLDTGLGKTRCQLEWCRQAAEATNGTALILTPLAVGEQIRREGISLGYDCRIVREHTDVSDGINICNYERLHKLDPDEFAVVSLDESSILKSFAGKTSQNLINQFANHRFKLSATATPAPNDHMELGQHASFCSVMNQREMLSRFFINDTSTASQQWRLKRHGINAFWNWMASWCRMAQSPSDLGYDDSGFALIPYEIIRHRSARTEIKGTGLFAAIEMSATNLHDVKRQTARARADVVADQVCNDDAEPWVVWCDTDYESKELMARMPFAVEVKGSMTADVKERNIAAFLDGERRVLVTKPSICGFGLNLQFCARTAFVGRSFSYETWYQAVRRFWRFGQTRQVQIHLVVAEGEEAISRVIDRKAIDHVDMKSAMAAAMRRMVGSSEKTKVEYEPKHIGSTPEWISAA